LEGQMNVFREIRAEPFQKNKRQLSKDLRVLRDAFVSDGIWAARRLRNARKESDKERCRQEFEEARRGLEARMALMRQGITWMLAKFHLEMRIIAPLSWLMADVRADQSAILRANNASTRGELDIHSSMQPIQFQEMRSRIERFADRAVARDDNLLRTRVKTSVLAHVAEARLCIEQEDWDEAKKQLIAASSVL